MTTFMDDPFDLVPVEKKHYFVRERPRGVAAKASLILRTAIFCFPNGSISKKNKT